MNIGKLLGPLGHSCVAVVEGSSVFLDPTGRQLADVLHDSDPMGQARRIVERASRRIPLSDAIWLAPIDRQEVWAAGVTYIRSRQARMEESESAARFYDRVYAADRPELFFKATPERVSGPGMPVRVRSDSQWSVPEPEWTLVVSPEMRLVGYTIGNDMSARDIEGENPLYLPQAKVYSQCAALGPTIRLCADWPAADSVRIHLVIERAGQVCFEGETHLGFLKRTPHELVSWLARENAFPNGVFLLTGTGIVPPDNFSLEHGDMVHIEISGIGRLSNPVIKE